MNAPFTPRPAATTLILRQGAPGLEVLMVQRSMQASFMPGAHVFPGGGVDAQDGSADHLVHCDEAEALLRQRIGQVMQVGDLAAAYAVGALRECFEECGLWLGGAAGTGLADVWAGLRARLNGGASMARLAADHGLRLGTRALQPWSHWVTPVGLPKRFDTLFFVAEAPAGQVPEVDAGETTALAWVHPPEALAEQAQGRFQMEFATLRTVESLLPFAQRGVAALLADAAAHTSLPPLHPRLHPRLQRDVQGRIAGVLLAGQAGYDEAGAAASTFSR